MKINKFVVLAGFAIASIEIPGQVLPAGTYLFKLADADNLNLVRVLNADGTRLYATLQTVPAEPMNPSGNTVVTLAEQSDERQAALFKWFYLGRATGHEFVYPSKKNRN